MNENPYIDRVFLDGIQVYDAVEVGGTEPVSDTMALGKRTSSRLEDVPLVPFGYSWLKRADETIEHGKVKIVRQAISKERP